MLRRLHPLDLAAASVLLVALAYVLVTVRGYRWEGTVPGGFLRVVEREVTIEVLWGPSFRLATELKPGRFVAETREGTAPIEILALHIPASGGPVTLDLRLPTEVDGDGRAFWSHQRIRRGEPFVLADASRRIAGEIADVR